MNKVILMGRLTNEPELRQTPNGTMVVKFGLAVRRRVANDQTDFLNCSAWRKTAEFVSKYFHKGNMIALSGRIETGSYQKDGQTVYTTGIVAEEVYFTGEKVEQGTVKPTGTPNPIGVGNNMPDYDDFVDMDFGDEQLPF